MELNDIKMFISSNEEKLNEVKNIINYDDLTTILYDLEQKTFMNDFWSDRLESEKVIKEIQDKKKIIKSYDFLLELLDEITVTYELSLDDNTLILECVDLISNYNKLFKQTELSLLLNKDYDAFSAIIELHPGAGGTESQDWCEMLYRMYKRWAEEKKYKIEIIDYLAGDEAGIKSVTFLVKGEYAYGYLKTEQGVHRLVRISPFDSQSRRHTSFASVIVIPEIDDTVSVLINEGDLKIDTYRSSGAGGQSVNTTDSAVRITHIPTNTIVTCQNERSQINNRDRAMQVLKGKLYQLEIEKQKKEIDSIRGKVLSNSWGSQIRSYVFHPYSMVKDHRTNYETGNAQKVMDGYIDDFIYEFLKIDL